MMEQIQRMFETLSEVFDYLEEHGNYALVFEGGIKIIFMGTLPPDGRDILKQRAGNFDITFEDDPRGLLLEISRN